MDKSYPNLTVCVKKQLPPNPNNWLYHSWNCYQAFVITNNESFTSLWRKSCPLFFAGFL